MVRPYTHIRIVGILCMTLSLTALIITIIYAINNSTAPFVGGILAFLGFLFASIFALTHSSNLQMEWFYHEGIPGIATVKSFQVKNDAYNPHLIFELEISTSFKDFYPLCHECVVPHSIFPLVEDGCKLDIRIDPEHPRRIKVFWGSLIAHNPDSQK